MRNQDVPTEGAGSPGSSERASPASMQLDPFARFRAVTPARIGLGRAGDALPTSALLDFQASHSRARDAVHGLVDFEALREALAPHPTLHIRSRAEGRAEYLRRPDLGRRVHPDDAPLLEAAAEPDGCDLVFVIADGLSAAAVMQHAAPLVHEVLERLPRLRIGPLVLASQGRVALGDEVGELMRARLTAVLLGERPGLSVADSLGIYLTWRPRLGRLDSERNCISNVHSGGLDYVQAASTLAWLIHEARRLNQSGIELKVDASPVTAELSA